MDSMAEKVKKYIKVFHAKYDEKVTENMILKMDRDWFESKSFYI